MLDDKFWDRYFEVYDVLNELYPYQDLLNKFIENLDLKAGEVVLDAGAGTGNLAQKIRERSGKVHAIDISSAGVRKILEKIPEADTCIGSLCDTLPYPDNFFDAIVSNNVIYTLPEKDRPSVARELYRTLKPGGRLIVSNISPNFSPFTIYLDHIRTDLKRNGFLTTLIKLVRFIPPTILMFWFNARIKKENAHQNYVFLNKESQDQFLSSGGFRHISFISKVYAGQAVMHKAVK